MSYPVQAGTAFLGEEIDISGRSRYGEVRRGTDEAIELRRSELQVAFETPEHTLDTLSWLSQRVKARTPARARTWSRASSSTGWLAVRYLFLVCGGLAPHPARSAPPLRQRRTAICLVRGKARGLDAARLEGWMPNLTLARDSSSRAAGISAEKRAGVASTSGAQSVCRSSIGCGRPLRPLRVTGIGHGRAAIDGHFLAAYPPDCGELAHHLPE